MITCRYVDRHGDRCTAEVLDPEGELLLCTRHTAAAIEYVHHVQHIIERHAS